MIESILVMVVVLLSVAIPIALCSILFFKFIRIKNSTARKIEIIGYIILFITLVWELWIKNITMQSFYDSDSYYINVKLDYIFMTLRKMSTDYTYINEDSFLIDFFNSKIGERVQLQMKFVDISEAILKISSTICIAIGRFQELLNQNVKE